MNLSDLLKDSAYKLNQFKPAQIAALQASITLKTTDKATTLYVNCLVCCNRHRTRRDRWHGVSGA